MQFYVEDESKNVLCHDIRNLFYTSTANSKNISTCVTFISEFSKLGEVYIQYGGQTIPNSFSLCFLKQLQIIINCSPFCRAGAEQLVRSSRHG